MAVTFKKRLKRKEAIVDPHQFTVKLTAERKTALKVLAAKRRMTSTVLVTNALRMYLENPPVEISRIAPPPKADRIVFKVEQTMREAVQSFTEAHQVPAQTVIAAAIDVYFGKYGG